MLCKLRSLLRVCKETLKLRVRTIKENLAQKRVNNYVGNLEYDSPLCRPISDEIFSLNTRELLWELQRNTVDYRLRLSLANKIANLINKKGFADFSGNVDGEKAAETLEKEGWTQIPDLLGAEEIRDIHQYLEDKPVVDFYNRDRIFDLKNIPDGVNLGRYPIDVNVRCPHLLKIVNSPIVLKAAEKYLGAKPTISVLTLMWSFKGDNDPIQMQLFHRDKEDYKFCKVFIYLTDVDGEDDGPHLYVKSSINPDDIRKGMENKFDGDELEAKVERLYENGRYTDKEVYESFPQEKIQLCLGKAGTSFMEDTIGIHRGVRPKSKHRLLIQAQFSLTPTDLCNYSPVKVDGYDAKGGLAHVNRLYIK